MALSFLDLIIAWVLYNRDTPVTQRQLLEPKTGGGLVNQALIERAVPSSYTPLLTSNKRLTESIKHLREVGLLQPSGTYVPTSDMAPFLDRLGADWRQWPILLPYSDDGAILWEQSEYRKSARGYRKKKGSR